MLNRILQWDDYYSQLLREHWMVSATLLFCQLITNAADAAIAGLLIYWLISLPGKGHNSSGRHILIGRILAPVVITAIATILLKILIHRGAPAPIIGPWLDLPFFPEKYVFPSGHTSRAFALATALSYEFPKWRWLLFVGALLIGFSRVYIGAHYPTDVIVGAALGIAITVIYHRRSKD